MIDESFGEFFLIRFINIIANIVIASYINDAIAPLRRGTKNLYSSLPGIFLSLLFMFLKQSWWKRRCTFEDTTPESRAATFKLFIAYPLWVSTEKARRLRALLERARVAIGLSSVEAAENLASALGGPSTLGVLIEVDSGERRSGVLDAGGALEVPGLAAVAAPEDPPPPEGPGPEG